MRWVCLLVMGCGRIAFDPSTDARTDTPVDALTTYRDVVLADGPVGYWRLDDTGSVARDELGLNDGTYSGGCTRSQAGGLAGDPSPSVLFDGTSCQIDLPEAVVSFIVGRQPFTIEVWAEETDATIMTRHIFTHETRLASNPVDGFALVHRPNDGFKLERVVSSTQVMGAQPYVAGFVHLVGIYDGSTVMISVNASPVSGLPDTRSASVISTPVLIGASSNGNFHQGRIDEVALYDHVLTQQQINLHHDVGINGPR